MASLTYQMPNSLPVTGPRPWIDSGTAAGEALLTNLRQHGAPRHLIDAGFVSVADFWPPWSVIVEEGVIVAMAFAARIIPQGAAIGVYTFLGFRGRGLAAAVDAGLAGHRGKQFGGLANGLGAAQHQHAAGVQAVVELWQ